MFAGPTIRAGSRRISCGRRWKRFFRALRVGAEFPAEGSGSSAETRLFGPGKTRGRITAMSQNAILGAASCLRLFVEVKAPRQGGRSAPLPRYARPGSNEEAPGAAEPALTPTGRPRAVSRRRDRRFGRCGLEGDIVDRRPGGFCAPFRAPGRCVAGGTSFVLGPRRPPKTAFRRAGGGERAGSAGFPARRKGDWKDSWMQGNRAALTDLA